MAPSRAASTTGARRQEIGGSRREIERHARHVGAADSDDFDRWLIAWSWHNQKSTDPVWALMNAAQIMGGNLSADEAEAILEDASNTRRRMSADNLARWLGLTYADRTALRITTIGATDVSRRKRKEFRRRKDRVYQARKRRARGARPHSESLSQSQPWMELGMSRTTWYRQNKLRNETDSSAAIFLSYDDESVSPTSRKYPEAKATKEYHGFTELPIELRLMALGLAAHVQAEVRSGLS